MEVVAGVENGETTPDWLLIEVVHQTPRYATPSNQMRSPIFNIPQYHGTN